MRTTSVLSALFLAACSPPTEEPSRGGPETSPSEETDTTETEDTEETDTTETEDTEDGLPGPCSFEWSSDGVGVDSRDIWRYDTDGNTTYWALDWNGDGLNNGDISNDYLYEDGLLQTESRYRWNDPKVPLFDYRKDYLYENGERISWTEDRDEDGEADAITYRDLVIQGDGSSIETTEYDYDADGELDFRNIRHRDAYENITRMEYDSDADGSIDETWTQTWTYDDDGNVLSVEEAENGEVRSRKVYT